METWQVVAGILTFTISVIAAVFASLGFVKKLVADSMETIEQKICNLRDRDEGLKEDINDLKHTNTTAINRIDENLQMITREFNKSLIGKAASNGEHATINLRIDNIEEKYRRIEETMMGMNEKIETIWNYIRDNGNK